MARKLDTSERLLAAKARLDTLSYYSEPVRVERVRVVVAPRLMRALGWGRFNGLALYRTILMDSSDYSEDLLVHELCHIWQGQQRPFHSLWAYLRFEYDQNPYEAEARQAVIDTRTLSAPSSTSVRLNLPTL